MMQRAARLPAPALGPEDVREACARVARLARAVFIDDERLASFADRLLESPPAPHYDTDVHFRGGEEDTLAYVLTLDAINFGSGWFSRLRKDPGRSGYGTIAARLSERFVRHGPWTASMLTTLPPTKLASIFAQEASGDIGELMRLYAVSLRALGVWLLEHWRGEFAGPVRAAGGSACRLVEHLSQCPAFHDTHPYAGGSIPLLKRAQIAAWDLALAFDHQGLGAFRDIDRLTAFADNVVPHVLRLGGVLRYRDDLAWRIDSGQRIVAGSPEEIELRACSVDAVERIVARHRAGSTCAALVDCLLWNTPRDARFRSLPRHQTRTTCY